jgi:hypothetical protein
MPDLSQLHELAGQVRTPDLGDLARLADGRRRRATAVLGGAVAATLVVVAVVTASVSGQRGAAPLPVGPGPKSSSTPTSTITTPLPDPSASYPVLSAQAIRRHPTAKLDADSLIATTAAGAGVAARVWTACMSDCSRATEYVPGEVQQAIEVTHDRFATSSLHAIAWSANVSHVLDDWFFVEGSAGGPMIVNSRGQRRPLEYGASVPVTGISGPVVYGLQGVSSVDLASRTLHAIETTGPDATWDWQGAGDTWFWGTVVLVDNGPVATQAALWRQPDGTFAVKVLPIPESEGGPGMLVTRRPGTMAVVEHFASPRLAHISTDYGATWEVRRVPDGVESGGNLPADWATWPKG